LTHVWDALRAGKRREVRTVGGRTWVIVRRLVSKCPTCGGELSHAYRDVSTTDVRWYCVAGHDGFDLKQFRDA
jgi:hypothetical protein